MSIDLVSEKRDMRNMVNSITPSGKDMNRRYNGSIIISSISFSSMLEDALRQELTKESVTVH